MELFWRFSVPAWRLWDGTAEFEMQLMGET